MTYILGVSAFYHDSAACLIGDGEILAAAQEERFSRVKHDSSFPRGAIDFCLRHAGITAGQLECVAFYEKPFLKFERILETHLNFAPSGIRSFITAMPPWIKRKLWTRDIIKKELPFEGRVVFAEHHESHAASAFYPSPFQEAAFLTVDGVGEWTTTSYGVGKDNDVRIMADMKFPHSLGLLYSAFTYYTGFRVNSAEYKVMGLAPYGEPRYKELILSELMELKDDGSFRLNMDYFDYGAGLRMTGQKFHSLFGGPPRKPESALTQREMDIARSVQEVAEEAMLRMARHVRKETGQRRLCLAGGVALNCVANGKLLREGIFEDIWVQPASGDAGGALGAALIAWHRHLGKGRTSSGEDAMKGTFLGPSYSEGEIRECLEKNGLAFHELSGPDVTEKTASLIGKGNVVGWFQGRMEFGPRALGARSILGDARSPRMQSHMNLKIKFREGFRPFAPAVLAEKAGDYFELDRPSPYMLFTADVKKERRKAPGPEEKTLTGLDKLSAVRSDIPAVTHVDYSARVQTVHKETNPLFHRLISDFEKEHGTAVVINTSFNVRGEPIVCSPQDACRCFMGTDMDFLAIGPYLLDKTQQRPSKENPRREKTRELG